MMYYTYILTNPTRTVLYTGVTNDLYRRIQEHREKKIVGFTAKYNISVLVWYDLFKTPLEAIVAEKRIKGWRRERKVALIQEKNPEFKDLFVEYRDPSQAQDDEN